MKKITLLILIVFTTITVHAQNKLLSSISEGYYNGTWQNETGINYEYDNNNNLTVETQLYWSNNTWEINYKTSYTYNANNKVTELLYYYRNATTNKLENTVKLSYTYTNGKVTELIVSYRENLDLEFSEKSVVSYNGNNLPDSYLSYDWDGTQWVNDGQGKLTYNANNKLNEELDEKLINSQWVNEYKTSYTYTANNKIANITDTEWDGLNSLWEETDRTEWEWDNSGNKIRETEISPYGSRNRDEYTYDTSKLMSNFAHPFKDKTGIDYLFEDVPHINKVLGYNSFYYNSQTSSYSINGRTTYNYNNSITLGTENYEITHNNIILFPNPTQDFLTIQNNGNAEIDKIIITDLSGKILSQQTAISKQIDVQNLPKGVYILEAFSGKDTFTSKFVKE